MTEFSDWDSFSDIPSFNSASDTFTDNHTDSEPEGIDISWLYTTVEEQKEDTARKRYLRRCNRYIQERDQRRLARELGELQEDSNTWITVEQDQDQDRDQYTSDQDTSDQDTSYQDTRPQKRRYSSEALDSSIEHRYPLRKQQLTTKAAAFIIE